MIGAGAFPGFVAASLGLVLLLLAAASVFGAGITTRVATPWWLVGTLALAVSRGAPPFPVCVTSPSLPCSFFAPERSPCSPRAGRPRTTLHLLALTLIAATGACLALARRHSAPG